MKANPEHVQPPGKIRMFFQTAIIGGLLVILPATIVLLIFAWIFGKILELVRPLARLLQTEAGMENILANGAALAIVLAACFFIGLFVRTRIGKWLYEAIENKLLCRVPTYSLIKETILQFSGAKKFPFSSVAMIKLYGSDVLTTGFVMNSHASGYQTVFIPTGPNPTSGMIYHVPEQDVFPIEVDVQETMRVIFNCGGGANKLLDKFIENFPERKHPGAESPQPSDHP